MPSVEYDLNYVRNNISQLEPYLLSKEVYWPSSANPPSGEPPYPRLTLGNLLLALARLHARRLTDDQRSELANLEEALDEVRNRWRVAWERKGAQEFHARLNLWRDFLQEYREHPNQNVDRYPYEVGRRVMLRLLEGESGAIPGAEVELMKGLDQLLRAVFEQGQFVWGQELAGGFPEKPYWYLWGRPRGE